MSAPVHSRSPVCLFRRLKEKVCRGSANSGGELLLPPARSINRATSAPAARSQRPRDPRGGLACAAVPIPPGAAPRWYLLRGRWEGAGLRGADPLSQPAASSQGTAWCQQGLLPLLHEARHAPACRVPGAAPCQGLSRGKADSGCCACGSPPLPGTTSTRAEHFLLHLSRTVLSRYEKTKLKHIIASNLKIQRNKENVPCQMRAARAHRLWSGDLYRVTPAGRASSIISLRSADT